MFKSDIFIFEKFNALIQLCFKDCIGAAFRRMCPILQVGKSGLYRHKKIHRKSEWKRIISIFVAFILLVTIFPVKVYGQMNITRALIRNVYDVTNSTASILHTASGSILGGLISSSFQGLPLDLQNGNRSLPRFRSYVHNNIINTIGVVDSAGKSLTTNFQIFRDNTLKNLPLGLDFHRTVIVCYRNYNPLNVMTMFSQRNMFFKLLLETLSLVVPINSIYLRHLGMEIIEVPDPFNLFDFTKRLISFTQFVEDVYDDEELGGFDNDIEVNTNNKSDEEFIMDDSKLENKTQINSSLEVQTNSRRLLGVEPNDPYFSKQWAHTDMGTGWGIETPIAWQHWTGEKLQERFIVAVIDSGIDFSHADLKRSIWKNPGEICNNGIDDDRNGFIDDCYGWDFVNNDNDPMDDNGHGTHSAGIIAAESGNGIGISGMCWKCSVMILKALNKETRGTISSFVRAIDYAIGHGAKVSNNSYGGTGQKFFALREAVRRAERAGMIFVAAAGNSKSGSNNDRIPVYPASYEFDNVISVAAIRRNGALTSFSHYGRKSVYLAAPGERIFTCTLRGYKYVDGTSYAAPFVAGAVALIWSREPALTYKEVILRILTYTKYSSNLEGRVRSKGTLNVWASMTANGKVLDVVPYVNHNSLRCAIANPCSENAVCVDTELGLKCTCKPGTYGDGITCHDVNECEYNPCGPVATCVNKLGHFECICNEGFKQVGDLCTDIDECSLPNICPKQATCINFIGSYDCLCPEGSAWNAKNFTDSRCLQINSPPTGPCANNGNCPYNSLCKGTGTFWQQEKECKCLDGYKNVPATDYCVRNGILKEQYGYYLDMISNIRIRQKTHLIKEEKSEIVSVYNNPGLTSMYNQPNIYGSIPQNGAILRKPMNMPVNHKPNNCVFGICLFAMDND